MSKNTKQSEVKQEEIIKIAARNIEQAKRHLNMVKDFAERDLPATPKTMRGFRNLLSENLDERIKALDTAIKRLNGGKQEIRIDGDFLGNAKWKLKEVGEFIYHMKDVSESDSSFNSPTLLFDSIRYLSIEEIKNWNDIVEELNELFFNLSLDTY